MSYGSCCAYTSFYSMSDLADEDAMPLALVCYFTYEPASTSLRLTDCERLFFL